MGVEVFGVGVEVWGSDQEHVSWSSPAICGPDPLLHCIALHSSLPRLHCITLHCQAQCTVLHLIVQHCTAVHCIAV